MEPGNGPSKISQLEQTPALRPVGVHACSRSHEVVSIISIWKATVIDLNGAEDHSGHRPQCFSLESLREPDPPKKSPYCLPETLSCYSYSIRVVLEGIILCIKRVGTCWYYWVVRIVSLQPVSGVLILPHTMDPNSHSHPTWCIQEGPFQAALLHFSVQRPGLSELGGELRALRRGKEKIKCFRTLATWHPKLAQQLEGSLKEAGG